MPIRLFFNQFLFFFTHQNELLAFLGWPYYILQRLSLLYAKFDFIEFIFSLLEGIYITCAIHTQVYRQASIAGILFGGIFVIISTSINKKLLDAQIKECKKNFSIKPNAYDNPQDITNTILTATSHLHSLHNNHPLTLVLQSY